MAFQFARNTIGFNVEDHHCAIHLEHVLVFWPLCDMSFFLVVGFTNSSRGKIIALVVEA